MTPKRILIAKPGLDGHDRGAINVAVGLRDHGFEVIYTGLRQTADDIVNTCVQEDVQAVGLSSMTGGHRFYIEEVTKKLKSVGLSSVVVIIGGIIPEEDREFLNQHGVDAIFGPGTKIKQIVEYLDEKLPS